MPNFKDYKSQYRDPRWQKRRLQIMERDEFTCQECGDTEETLNVHHRAYRKGADVWDYHDDQLVTLCQTCHQATEGVLSEVRAFAGLLTNREQAEVIGFMRGLLYRRILHDPEMADSHTVCFLGWDEPAVEGYLRAFPWLGWLPSEVLEMTHNAAWCISTGHADLQQFVEQVQERRKSEGRSRDLSPKRTVTL